MNTVLWIILVFVALLAGFYGGAYFARKQMEKELAENPRLNVDAVRTMMSAAGQKPNEARVRQTYNQIIKQQKQALANSKEKEKIMVGSWDVNLSFLHVT
ncbi:Hypothetical protein PS4_86421 [Streptococcus salivarius PS4]|nr:Hypothetical protein PS4_86421 [Streptococcus salivarius PS4]